MRAVIPGLGPALFLLFAGCSGAVPPESEESTSDGDGDGWTPLDGDCDDSDPLVNPDGVDWPGDGDDQDCDGADSDVLTVPALMPGELALMEVQKRPIGVQAAAGEWFELRNDAGFPIDLRGLLVRNEEGDAIRVNQTLLVEPMDQVVLGAVADRSVNGQVDVDYAYGTGLRIANESGSLELLAGESIVASLFWDLRFPDESGRTMQRSPDAADGSLPESWCAGPGVYGVGGFGSPGVENVPCEDISGALTMLELAPGDLVITEIMKDPALVDGAFGEWVELFNATGQLMNLDGLELVDEEGEGVQIQGPRLLPAGGYAVFAASDDPAVNGGISQVVTAWGSAFALRNSDDTVILRFGTREFDRVVYDNGDTFPDETGIAFQTNPDTSAGANDLGSAWCNATTPYGDGDLGTPGTANPVCPI